MLPTITNRFATPVNPGDSHTPAAANPSEPTATEQTQPKRDVETEKNSMETINNILKGNTSLLKKIKELEGHFSVAKGIAFPHFLSEFNSENISSQSLLLANALHTLARHANPESLSLEINLPSIMKKKDVDAVLSALKALATASHKMGNLNSIQIKLDGKGINDERINYLAGILPQFGKLHAFEIDIDPKSFGAKSSHAFFSFLQVNSDLKKITVNAWDFSRSSSQLPSGLADFIAEAVKVEEISLNKFELGEETMRTLTNALGERQAKGLEGLKTISIERSHIQTAELESFLDALPKNEESALEILNLYGTRPVEFSPKVVKLLSQQKKLQCLGAPSNDLVNSYYPNVAFNTEKKIKELRANGPHADFFSHFGPGLPDQLTHMHPEFGSPLFPSNFDTKIDYPWVPRSESQSKESSPKISATHQRLMGQLVDL